MHIHKNDNVMVISGKDRGKHGKVLQVFPGEERVVVEGINKMVKHLRPGGRKQNRGEKKKGEKIAFFGPIAIANAMLICPACGKPSRIGMHIDEAGEKRRTCKKCAAVFA